MTIIAARSSAFERRHSSKAAAYALSLWGATVALACVACGKAASDQNCTRRVERLQDHLAKLDLSPARTYFGPDHGYGPTASFSLALDEPAPLVQVRAGDVRLDGRRFGSLDSAARVQFVQDLETLVRNYGILHPSEPRSEFPIYVLAEPQLSIGTVLEVARAIPPPYRARLLVRQSSKPIDPTPEGASAQLRSRIADVQASSGDDRMQRIASLLRDGVGAQQCEALDDVFRAVSERNAEDKGPILAKDVPAALRRCRCRAADVDAIEASLMLLLAPEGPAMGWLPIDGPDTDPVAQRLSVAPDATVQHAADSLAAALRAGRRPYLQPSSSLDVPNRQPSRSRSDAFGR